MTEIDASIWQAVRYLQGSSSQCPKPKVLLESLLQAEKLAKQARDHYDFERLCGTWRLGFITGTQQARRRASWLRRAGWYVPRWADIRITYSPSDEIVDCETVSEPSEQGSVVNAVLVGPFSLTVSGPTRLWHRKTILAFDFIHLQLQISGLNLYNQYIRDGRSQVERFYRQPLKDQAFFTYFLVRDECIAARGRGGGLALWARA